ncbi:hypothetical protein TNCV_4211061 [Trichonephila clavipes]|nr:hypothetical protein TNCV_4211061 [Trichonephila clavipes]
MVWPSRESPTAAFCQKVVRPKSVIKIVSESVSIRRACAYISRRFTSVFWRGFFFETQSAFLIGLESAEGYPLAVDDSPKTREIPQNNPNHDVFMGTLPSSRRGKRVTLFVGSLVYVDKPQTLDHLEDNIRRVIADIRPQMLEKVIENWTSRLDYIRVSRGSPMPEIIFKM